jgi:hypothetical protein
MVFPYVRAIYSAANFPGAEYGAIKYIYIYIYIYNIPVNPVAPYRTMSYMRACDRSSKGIALASGNGFGTGVGNSTNNKGRIAS